MCLWGRLPRCREKPRKYHIYLSFGLLFHSIIPYFPARYLWMLVILRDSASHTVMLVDTGDTGYFLTSKGWIRAILRILPHHTTTGVYGRYCVLCRLLLVDTGRYERYCVYQPLIRADTGDTGYFSVSYGRVRGLFWAFPHFVQVDGYTAYFAANWGYRRY